MKNTLLLLVLSCQQEPIAEETTKNTTQPTKANIDKTYDRLIKGAFSSSDGMTQLTSLCDDIGHRLSGSKELEEAVKWGAAEAKKIGLENIRLQPVMVPNWKRGNESLELLHPKNEKMPMLGLGMSVGTNGFMEGEVHVFSSFEDLQKVDQVNDKIVLFNAPFTTYGKTVRYRSQGANKAAEKGAKAVLVRSVTPSSLQSPHTGGLRYKNEKKIPAAAISIEDAERLARWYNRGIVPQVKLYMEAEQFPDAQSHNVLADIKGVTYPQQVVVIGAHLDSWDVGQGAQDDGAGVVIVLQAAKLIKSLQQPPKRTIRVILYTNEENGLKGAQEYANSVTDPTTHFAAIEADIGAGAPSHFSYQLPKAMKIEDFDPLKKALKPVTDSLKEIGMGELQEGYSGADIGRLVNKGVIGFGLRMNTDGYWPIHHTHADTIDKISPENLQKNIAAMAILAWSLANVEL